MQGKLCSELTAENIYLAATLPCYAHSAVAPTLCDALSRAASWAGTVFSREFQLVGLAGGAEPLVFAPVNEHSAL